MQGVTESYKKITEGYRGLQGVTEGYKGLLGVRKGYKGVKGGNRK